MKSFKAAMAILLLAAVALPCVAANDAKEQEARIARVEAGLLPPILWKGEPRVGASLDQRMARAGVPGVSVAVVDRYDLVWARGWGVLRKGGEEAVTPDAPFQAGSISKTVTALVTLRLVAHGKLGLDDPINSRLKSWKLPDSEAGGDEPVTVRNLLTHSAGLAPITYLGVDPSGPIPKLLDLLNGKGQEPPPVIARVEPPGKRFSYSNPGYLILQQLLVDVSGKSFDELASAELFQPLGMTSSSFAHRPAKALLDRAAWGHDSDGEPIASKGLAVPAAVGGLWTTPSDLARLLAAVMRSYRGEDGSFLPKAIVREAMMPQVASRSLLGAVEGLGSSRYLVQMGAMPGFIANIVACPELGRGAVIMINAGGRSGALTREIARAIAVEYEWPDFVDEFERVTLPVEKLATFVGQYELDNPPGFRIRVTVKDGGLLWMDREMIAVRGGAFVIPSAAIRAEFVRGEDGAIVAVDFGPPGSRAVRARRVE